MYTLLGPLMQGWSGEGTVEGGDDNGNGNQIYFEVCVLRLKPKVGPILGCALSTINFRVYFLAYPTEERIIFWSTVGGGDRTRKIPPQGHRVVNIGLRASDKVKVTLRRFSAIP